MLRNRLQMRSARRAMVLTAMLLTLTGCSAAGQTPVEQPHTPTEPASEIDARWISADTGFAFRLLNQLQADAPAQNLFLSPASISLALSLTYNGANGDTARAMAQTLGVAGLPLAELNQANRTLQSVLANPDPKVELRIANSLWFQQGRQLAPAFLAASQSDYQAAALPVDFGSPETVGKINTWVKQATAGKIPSMLQETRKEDRLYLVNAVYFNGTWTEPFDPEQTRPRPFHLPDGSARDLPFMNQAGRYRYLKGDNFQAVALPYGSGRISLYVFLPNDGTTVADFSRRLTAQQWQRWMEQFASKEGSISLPKVKVEWGQDLAEQLRTMGMGVAFDPKRADFRNFFTENPEPLYISFVLHKSYLDLNEQGTEATAATVVGMRAGSAPPDPSQRFSMVVDRPYLLVIRDDRTGAILFLGAIYNPA